MRVLLGIDIGTTGCKVCTYDGYMRLLGSAYKEYPLIFSDGFVELSSDVVFDCVSSCILTSLSGIDKNEVEAISVSSMTDTFTPLGGDGRPLMNSIVSFDQRAAQEALFLEKEFGREELFNITGLPMHSMYPGCKILWLNKNMPEVASKTWKYLSYEDFILFKLGAPPVSSYSMTGKTLMFDMRTLEYSGELLRACGAKQDQMPEPVPSGKPVGRISAEAAQAFGLPDGVKLVSGGFDQACCALAFGVLEPGDILNTIGTNEIIYFPIDKQNSHNLYHSNMNLSCHVTPGGYGSYAQIFNAGGAFKWCRDTLFAQEKQQKPDVYSFITSHLKREPEQLLFLPFLSGIGTPDMNNGINAAFYGLKLETDRFALAQAIIEGINCESKYNFDTISQIIGVKPSRITVVGGGSRSDYWMQLKSDMFNIEVNVPKNAEPGAAGAAILAGAGCGAFKDHIEGSRLYGKTLEYKKYTADPAMHESLSEKAERYYSFRDAARQTCGFTKPLHQR